MHGQSSSGTNNMNLLNTRVSPHVLQAGLFWTRSASCFSHNRLSSLLKGAERFKNTVHPQSNSFSSLLTACSKKSQAIAFLAAGSRGWTRRPLKSLPTLILSSSLMFSLFLLAKLLIPLNSFAHPKFSSSLVFFSDRCPICAQSCTEKNIPPTYSCSLSDGTLATELLPTTPSSFFFFLISLSPLATWRFALFLS